MGENYRFMGPYGSDYRACTVASECIIVIFPSYSALLMLNNSNRMEKSWMACHWAEEEGISFREAERVVESELFLNEYSQWGLGTPHWAVILHEMFLHHQSMGAEGGRMYVPPRLPK